MCRERFVAKRCPGNLVASDLAADPAQAERAEQELPAPLTAAQIIADGLRRIDGKLQKRSLRSGASREPELLGGRDVSGQDAAVDAHEEHWLRQKIQGGLEGRSEVHERGQGPRYSRPMACCAPSVGFK